MKPLTRRNHAKGKGGRRRNLLLGTMLAFAVLGLAAAAAQAAPKTSSAVAYVTDFGTGSNDKGGPGSGSSIFVDALTGTAPEGSYTTADKSKTVSVKDVSVATIDEKGVAALAGYDTVIVYQVCDIGSHAATVGALNTFLLAGGKVLLFDADRCAPGVGGLADYSAFLFPFTTSSPGPQGASGSYTTVVASTLTTGLAVGPQEGDSVGDANIFTSFSGGWCASISATNTLGANGFVEATARTSAGGLVVYEGEDFWFSFGPTAHLRLVFDDELKQDWAPDGLPCTIPASGITLSPANQTQEVGTSATVTAKVVDTEGKPVSGVLVTFKVNSGPNAGQTGTGTTDEAGQTTFTYNDTGGGGKDSLTASFVGTAEETHTSNVAEVFWGKEEVTECNNAVGEGRFRIGHEGQSVRNKLSTNLASKQSFVFSWENGKHRVRLTKLTSASCVVTATKRVFSGRGDAKLDGVPGYVVGFRISVNNRGRLLVKVAIWQEHKRIAKFLDIARTGEIIA